MYDQGPRIGSGENVDTPHTVEVYDYKEKFEIASLSIYTFVFSLGRYKSSHLSYMKNEAATVD